MNLENTLLVAESSTNQNVTRSQRSCFANVPSPARRPVRHAIWCLNKEALRGNIFTREMKFSWTLLFSAIFIGYVSYSMYTFALLFRGLECSDKVTCFQSFLNKNPKLQLVLFTSHSISPISSEVEKLTNIRAFDYHNSFTRLVANNREENFSNFPSLLGVFR